MSEVRLLQSLGQVSSSQTGQVFRDFLRGQVRQMICEVMATNHRNKPSTIPIASSP